MRARVGSAHAFATLYQEAKGERKRGLKYATRFIYNGTCPGLIQHCFHAFHFSLLYLYYTCLYQFFTSVHRSFEGSSIASCVNDGLFVFHVYC